MAPPAEDALPVIEKLITQDRIERYSRVSGDHNPVHLDPAFAAKSSFGRIVAHGMMTLGFVSEMMTQRFGEPWLRSGSLKVRFKGPAYPGDRLLTRGRVSKWTVDADGTLALCDVALVKADGQEVITGAATVRLPKEQEL